MADDATKQAYRDAYDDWHAKLLQLHEVLVDGTRTLEGDQMKGLLNREARAKVKYDEARLALLGFGPQESPFGE
jgi:hypothetical protein